MKGSGRNKYDCDNGSDVRDFNFLFEQIVRCDNPVILGLGSAKRGAGPVEGHNVLAIGVDNGTNIQKIVKVHNPSSERESWVQAYDLERGRASELKNRKWLSSIYCR